MTALSSLLDELMGKNRNAAPNEKLNEQHWSDEDVCKHFLCGFCPAELFTNTRADLGACTKSHDERTRTNYQESSRCMKMGYEEDFLRFLQQCWQDVERRIRRNHQRLQLTEEKSQQKAPVAPTESEETVQVLNKRITEMLEKIEKLGSEGEVEQAQAMMKLCDQLKEEREQLQTQKGGIMDTFAVQEKQMEVCEVCGAFLIVGDAQARVDDHLMGKQHMGYAKIKTAIAEIKGRLTKAAEENRSSVPDRETTSRERDRRDPPRNSRDDGRSRDSGRDDRRTRDSGRDGGRSRDVGRVSRDRDQDRRSRDHRDDRHRNSRDDRHRNARDQDRRQSRDRGSRDRDRRRSRDRRSSRDRDRRSSRDRDRRSSRDRDRRSSRDRRRSKERKSSRDRDRKDDKRRHDRSLSRDKKRSKRRSSKERSLERSAESKRRESESPHKERSSQSDENHTSDIKASIQTDSDQANKMETDDGRSDKNSKDDQRNSEEEKIEGESGTN